MMLLMVSLITLNVLILTLFNPLALGMAIIMQALLVAITTSLLMPTFWFSYILILIYLGGLLVLFIYVSSLASNEQMNYSKTFMIYALLSLGLAYATAPNLTFSLFMSTDNFFFSEGYAWMFTSSSILAVGILMVYLFIVLIAVVKITKWWGGSLRPDSSY